MMDNLMFLCLYIAGLAMLLLIACTIEWLYLKWWGRKQFIYHHSMRDWK